MSTNQRNAILNVCPFTSSRLNRILQREAFIKFQSAGQTHYHYFHRNFTDFCMDGNSLMYTNSHLYLQTSFLYSMFASQVESFCDLSAMKNCNVELLKYGLNKLKKTPEDSLDNMDPYQRNANKISKYFNTVVT